jgi:predicted ATPase
VLIVSESSSEMLVLFLSSIHCATELLRKMIISRLKLKNWRNFRDLDIGFREISYVLGPNASGKSNLLDVFRFLRDVSKSKGGGLQTAIADRGGMSKLRCLHARKELEFSDGNGEPVQWKYVLGFKSEGKVPQRVSREEVWYGNRQILQRPSKEDLKDPALLTQTHLEQIQANAKFRELVSYFSSLTYLHLVPQLLKFSDRLAGRQLDDDPFGQGFLQRIAQTPEKTRDARLKKISHALTLAVPQFKELRFKKDDLGQPHLEALYAHHRPNAGWQSEEHFSDGTLRLLGLLWSLLDGEGMLLLEEPEISLNDSIVKQIPLIISRLQRDRKNKRQILISTHSEALLSNPGIDGEGIVLLETTDHGTQARTIRDDERLSLDAGLSVAEVVLPKTKPAGIQQLGLW